MSRVVVANDPTVADVSVVGDFTVTHLWQYSGAQLLYLCFGVPCSMFVDSCADEWQTSLNSKQHDIIICLLFRTAQHEELS